MKLKNLWFHTQLFLLTFVNKQSVLHVYFFCRLEEFLYLGRSWWFFMWKIGCKWLVSKKCFFFCCWCCCFVDVATVLGWYYSEMVIHLLQTNGKNTNQSMKLKTFRVKINWRDFWSLKHMKYRAFFELRWPSRLSSLDRFLSRLLLLLLLCLCLSLSRLWLCRSRLLLLFDELKLRNQMLKCISKGTHTHTQTRFEHIWNFYLLANECILEFR